MIPPGQGGRESFAPMQVPLAGLPPGIKIGDTIQLSVDDIDEATAMATLSADKALGHGENDPFAKPSEDGMPTSALPTGNNTDVLLGPMNGLKNYLVQKSQNNSQRVSS